MGVPDGRYLGREGGEQERQRVLVVETLGAPPPPSRRRRQPRPVEAPEAPESIPLTRATTVLAYMPFDFGEEALAWLDRVAADDDELQRLLDEGVGLINKAVHAGAVARADPRGAEIDAERAVRVRIGYGSGEEVAAGRFAVAREVDLGGAGGSRRRQREAELRPQERLAAVLGAREQLNSCETLLLRARADFDAGRMREAALQLRVGMDALLVELAGALKDPGTTRTCRPWSREGTRPARPRTPRFEATSTPARSKASVSCWLSASACCADGGYCEGRRGIPPSGQVQV